MKVLHFYRTYFPETQGGLEEAIRQICKATRPLGVESRVLTLAPVSEPRQIDLPEATVYQYPLQAELASCSVGFSLFKAYRHLSQWADLVHIHYPWPFADLVYLVSGSKTPVLLTYHSDVVRQKTLDWIYSPLRTLFLSKVDRIIATSPSYVETSPVLGRYKHKTSVIPLGLDPDMISAPSMVELNAVEAKYGKDFFFFVGVLRPYKGLRYLLEAACRAPFNVVIAGSGPEEETLKRTAHKLALSNVTFCGRVSDERKAALIQLSRAIVFPSCMRSEAFGVTLLEGAAMAKPLISCELGTGTSYVNQDGETGYIVPPRAPAPLRDAMMKLYLDPNQARQLGEGAKRRFENLFSAEKLGRFHKAEYERLLHPECRPV